MTSDLCTVPQALPTEDPERSQEPVGGPEHDCIRKGIARAGFLAYLMHGELVDGPVGIEELVHRPQWMAWGACRDEPREVFFPRRGEDPRPAKAICARCLVRSECLDLALADVQKVGIWGGTSEKQRRRLRQQRHRSAVA